MHDSLARQPQRSAGFTLVELMVTLFVLSLVMVVLATVMNSAAGSKTSTSNRIESSQATWAAVDMMARDLRNCGYGADRDYNPLPQPPIAYIDSMQVLINANMAGDAVGDMDTTAYDPSGNPKPYPLNGTAWAPPIKYRTRAEVIRWTLDVNNDGNVDAADIASSAGVDARRTKNPNDYILVREVYGDSTSGTAGDNGGNPEPIALVRRPTDAGVPPLFQVYLFGSPTPWDWSSGPLPPGRLQDIERIVIHAVGTSAKPNWRGAYAETRYETEVNTTRNMPGFGDAQYAVDGWVFVDQNSNGTPESGEPRVGNAAVRLGTYSTFTDNSGYFQFRVFAGTYTLKHTPPPGFVNATSPDSFVVSVGPAQTRSFTDAMQSGGTVDVLTFEDTDGNGLHDSGEPVMPSMLVRLDPTMEERMTDGTGLTSFFAPVGNFTVSVTPPAGYAVTGTHPYSGTMINGGNDAVAFGITGSATGTITGRVFADNNRNGVQNSGEPGLENVWVGVSPDGGLTVVGYAYTDLNGDYSINVPANDPPGTTPYYVSLVVPNGYYPTGPSSLGPMLITNSQVVSGNNFGVASFQVITLNASRVLSLGSADLIEKDWNGNDNQWSSKGHQDADIVLGADASGTDNVSVWFNNYYGTPLFDANPSYARNAPNSVLSMSVAMLDNNVPQSRYDVVTGTNFTSTGNFFVWFTKNSSNNGGYLPDTPDRSYTTNDNGDVQAVVTLDVGNGSSTDIVVGTKSATAREGTIEVWLSNDAATPTYTRDEIYPTSGAIPGGMLGEVTSMALADLDGDGDQDLVVGTHIDDFSGQLLMFENAGRTSGNRFICRHLESISTEAVMALTTADFNGDGRIDVVLGTRQGANAGALEQWTNLDNAWNFSLARRVVAPGIVMSVTAADLGGSATRDVIMGFRTVDPGYAGGVRVYFMDLGVLPPFGTDPSTGAIVSMVPALAKNNFNYGVNPSTPSPPYLDDFAAGVKTGPSTGALVIFIR